VIFSLMKSCCRQNGALAWWLNTVLRSVDSLQLAAALLYRVVAILSITENIYNDLINTLRLDSLNAIFTPYV